MSKLLILKLVLTCFAAAAVASPLFFPNAKGGVLNEVALLGPVFGPMLIAVFFSAIAFYAWDLKRLFKTIPRKYRAAHPHSVWWMFLIPYNFIEDFFIIQNLTRSLHAYTNENAAPYVKWPYGAVTGFGWCALQIVSLFPHSIGAVSGGLAIILWIAHWRFVRLVIHRIKASL